MVGVCVVYGIVFSFAHIGGERFIIVFVTSFVIWFSVRVNKILHKRIWAGSVPRWIRQVQDVVDLTVREARLVLPALQQVLRRVGERHAFGEGAETGFVPHRPAFKGSHARDCIVDAGEGRASEPGV